jgi:hypothetical protein
MTGAGLVPGSIGSACAAKPHGGGPEAGVDRDRMSAVVDANEELCGDG